MSARMRAEAHAGRTTHIAHAVAAADDQAAAEPGTTSGE